MSYRCLLHLLFSTLLAIPACGPSDSTENPSPSPTEAADTDPRQDQQPIIISRETTYLTGPLREDGRVDYLRAVNERVARGVTPENNAVVLFLQAVGPAVINQDCRERYFAALGIEPLPESGDYFVELDDAFPKDNEQRDDDGRSERDRLWDGYEDSCIAPWTAADYPEIAQFIGTNQKAIDLLVQASQRPKFYDPAVGPDPAKETMIQTIASDVVQKHRRISEALVSRAMLRLGSGDADGSRADLLASHRLARVVGAATGDRWLISFVIARRAARADAAWAHYGHRSAGEIRQYRQELVKLPPRESLAAVYDGVERFFSLEMLIWLANSPADQFARDSGWIARGEQVKKAVARLCKDGMIDWNETLRTTCTSFDELVTIVKVVDRHERHRRAVAFAKKAKESAKQAAAPALYEPSRLDDPEARSRIGRNLAAKPFNSIAGIALLSIECQDDHRMRMAMGELALALAQYRAEKGAYPTRLNALVPQYVAEIPDDVHSDGPLRYRKTGDGYVLYGVGRSGVDHGGRPYEDVVDHFNDEADDIVIRMPVKP